MIRYLSVDWITLFKKRLAILVYLSISQFAVAQTGQQIPCGETEYQKLYSLVSDSIVVESVDQSTVGPVLVGKISNVDLSPNSGFAMQLDSNDKVVWAKKYLSSSGVERLMFLKCKKVLDGFIIIGRISTAISNIPSNTLIVKMNFLGNVLWVKEFRLDINLYPNAELQVQSLEEAMSGDILLSGAIYINGFSTSDREGFVARLNNMGELQFAHSFVGKNTLINDCFGIYSSSSKIMVFGVTEEGLCSSLDPRSIYSMSIDYNTGTVLGINHYCFPEVFGNISFPELRHNWTFSKTAKGFQIAGFLRSNPLLDNFMIANFDSTGIYFNGFQVQDQNLSKGNYNFLTLKNADILIQTAYRTKGAFQSHYSSSGSLLGQVYYPLTGLYTNDLQETGSLSLENTSSVEYFLPCISPGSSIKLFKRTLTNHVSNLCVGVDSVFEQKSSSMVLSSNPMIWQSVIDNPFQLTSTDFNVSDLIVSEQIVCSDTVSNTHLKIVGPNEICSGQSDIVYHSVQNSSSNKKTFWSIDSSWMQKLNLVNDSTVEITAQSSLIPGQIKYVHAGIEGCDLVQDSIIVEISSNSPDSVVLAADTSICPGDALVLKTAGKFQSYLWQDGSVDSIFLTSNTGLYSLTAVNYCGVRTSDIINIKSGLNCPYGIYFPNVFSPNSDGFNDIFRPVVRSPVNDYSLQIYNRYGQLLFESHSPGLGWNGTFHNQVQNQDTYVWCAHYTLNGKIVNQCNTVVLVH